MVCATRAVSSGMAGIGCGCNDMCFLLGALTISLLSVSHMLAFASLRIRQQYLSAVLPHSFEQKVIARTAFPHCCAICVQNSHGSRRTCEAEHCPTTLSLLPYSSSFSL